MLIKPIYYFLIVAQKRLIQCCWAINDICFESQLKELYLLLNENYVEDDDNMFRFDYSPDFLRWALQPPGQAPIRLTIYSWLCSHRMYDLDPIL